MKKGFLFVLVLALVSGMCLSFMPTPALATDTDDQTTASVATGNTTDKEYELVNGVNILKEGQDELTFNIKDGQALMISGQEVTDTDPLVFKNCTFNLSGGTVKISNGEVVTKLWIGGNVQFENCRFITADGATKTTAAGYDAAIYFFGGDIQLKDCDLNATGYNGQFLGLYGSTGAVTFDHCHISTLNNKNGWSYAMYGGSVLKLTNQSTMTAKGMSTDSGNINAFYSGDNRTGYDAIFVEDSTIDFSDNQAGGFAINNVNIHVDNSTIKVNNNLGNACNSGYWMVNDSTIQMNGNRGGHALSCIGFEMTDSTLEVLHNGYAGVYIQSRDSSLTNGKVDIRCNGERLLSYSAGDVWLNGHTLTVSGTTTSNGHEGALWLGGVGRTGSVVTTGNAQVVAYDLNANAADNLKSNTSPVLTNANIALDNETDEHTLFLNPFMETGYARGNAETSASNNDADLFEDDRVTDRNDIIGAENAKIGVLTTAQLGHHIYDLANDEVVSTATQNAYGVLRYQCTECAQYIDHTADHSNSFDCEGTYIYAPLVSFNFDKNTEDEVTNMPANQTEIIYGNQASEGEAPEREGYQFIGWYVDPEGTEAFDFTSSLTTPLTTVYAKWIPQTTYVVEHQYYTSTNGGEYVLDGSYTTDAVYGNIGDTISASTIEQLPVYNDVTYTFDHASEDIVLVEDAAQNKIILVYHRDVTVDIDVDPEEPMTPDEPTTPEEPEETDPVQTGDQTPMMMLALGLTISALGIAVSVKKRIS